MTGVKGTAQLAFDILVNAITLPEKAYTMMSEEIRRGGAGFLSGPCSRRGLGRAGRVNFQIIFDSFHTLDLTR